MGKKRRENYVYGKYKPTRAIRECKYFYGSYTSFKEHEIKKDKEARMKNMLLQAIQVYELQAQSF